MSSVPVLNPESELSGIHTVEVMDSTRRQGDVFNDLLNTIPVSCPICHVSFNKVIADGDNATNEVSTCPKCSLLCEHCEEMPSSVGNHCDQCYNMLFFNDGSDDDIENINDNIENIDPNRLEK